MGGVCHCFPLFPPLNFSIFCRLSLLRCASLSLFQTCRFGILSVFLLWYCGTSFTLTGVTVFPLLIGSKQHGFLGPLRGTGTYFYPGIKKQQQKNTKIAKQNQEKQQYMIKVDASHTPHCAR